jgi:methylmalonyl-CoA mutase
VVAVAAALFAVARKRDVAVSSLRGSLGADPIGTLASDGALPCSLDSARELLVELVRAVSADAGKLRAVNVSTSPYHNAGATSVQEVAYALATGVEYLRWLTAAGIEINAAASAIGFSCSIGNDLFTEVAKLRALRSCWAKVVAASGGSAEAQNTTIHAATSQRTKTVRDPWVNMLRTTTESFSAMVGGADSLTTLGFDEIIGPSDSFSRRIARNVQVVLNEEAHITHVADPAGGSYFVEALTDQLATDAWKIFQAVETQGSMSKALLAGAIAKDIAEIAEKRNASIRKRGASLLGVSEFANLGEEAIERPAPRAAKVNATNAERLKSLRAGKPQAAAVAGVVAARSAKKPLFAAAVDAAVGGASIGALSNALAGDSSAAIVAALPVRRNADVFEALRTRCETGKSRPTVFLANLGAIPQHKARSTFSTGFMNAGGVAVLDNEGFATPEEVAAAFAKSGSKVAVICGSDDQYPEWVPKLAPLLRAQGAIEVLLAGRPGDHEAAFKEAGVGVFLFMGSDVVTTLSNLLDRMGVAS